MTSNSYIHAVVFDAFGTLVEIGDFKRPFGRLLKWIREHHKEVAYDEARWLMSQSLDLRGVIEASGVEFPNDFFRKLEDDLAAELASITLFSDSLPTLIALQARGIKIGICSNLAEPYAAPVQRLVTPHVDVYTWSFAVGAIKPDPEIYAAVCKDFNCQPASILFVGDTKDADVDGPQAFGMQSLHLTRDTASTKRKEIATLSDVLQRLPHG